MTPTCPRRALALVIVLASSLPLVAQDKPRTMEEMHRMHQDAKAYIASLEDPTRDQYQKPHEVVMALGLKEGERIADIGAGSGYFALRFAHHVGSQGIVYAVDINPDMIRHLNERVRDAGLANVRTILARQDDPLLPGASLDRVFFCDVWHHIESRGRYLETVKKTLKAGGQVVLIDFTTTPTPLGPPPEMRLGREAVIKEFEAGGFRLVKEHTFLPYQYFLVFEVAGEH